MANRDGAPVSAAANRAPQAPQAAFVWQQFGPYHMDRCEAMARALVGTGAVLGIEQASSSDEYAWDATGAGAGFVKETLFPGQRVEVIGPARRFLRLVGCLVRSRARHIFLCNANLLEILAAAIILRGFGRRVYAMSESKFDDRPRSAWREVAKKLFYLPYHGVLVGGARTAQYMRFLGFADAAIATGYDAVGLDRVRRLAGAPPAPDGTPFARRHFTVVARLVEKKNLTLAIDAYREYRTQAAAPRDLVIFGSGPLEDDLRARAGGLDGIRFAGFVQADGVARGLATSLALILPSVEEQWGLVVNEALAMGVPVLVTDQVGARDALVRTAVNGYVFEPDNAEGLARLMLWIGGDEAEWRRLCDGANRFAPEGDVARFVDGARALMERFV